MNTFHVFGFIVLAHVTVITSVAILLVWFGRHRSAFQHTVGVAGLLLTLSSPILALTLPQQNWFHTDRSSKAKPDWEMSNSAVEAPTSSGFAPVLPSVQELTATESMTSSGPQTGTIQDRRPPAPSVPSKTILAVSINSLFAVWFLGSVWAVYRLRKSRRTLRCLSRSRTTISSSRLERIEHEVCVAVKMDALPLIRVTELAPIPLVLGILRPIVILPKEFAESASDECLRDVLIHECAHIVRRDPWVHALQQVAAILFWVHPGIHWLNQKLSRLREELCDNFVIQRGDPIGYSQTLLVLSEFCGRQRHTAPALGLFSSRWTLEERIRDLLDLKRMTVTQTRWETKLGLGILFGIGSVLVGGLSVVRISSAEQQTGTSKTLNAEDSAFKTPEVAQVPRIRTIIVRGECLDDDLKTIPNVAIRVYRYQAFSDPPALVASSETDNSGRFKLEGVGAATDRDLSVLVLTARATGYASAIVQLNKRNEDSAIELVLSSNPQTLSGRVTDVNGQPIPKVLVSQFPFYPPPEVWSAITDEQGRYEITDAREWIPQDRQGSTKSILRLRHPDFPLSKAYYTRIPQQVNVTLKPPAIVEGRVIDATTNEPVPNVDVHAQGIARHGDFHTKTDSKGRYRLRMTKDHYNIWADMDERIPIAVKAIEAIPGETAMDADIKMVRGGIIVGTLFNVRTNEAVPIPEGQTRYVAHYGPARPSSGAAVTTAKVNSDGTFRLRVAPGLNYVYFMGGDMAGYVTVEDGEELKLNLVNEKPGPGGFSRYDPDQWLRSELTKKAEEEDADEAAANEQ